MIQQCQVFYVIIEWVELLGKSIILYLQDGRINYDEFTAMMRKNTTDTSANPKRRREGVFVS